MAGSVRIAILANGSKAREEMSSVGREGLRLGSTLKQGLAVGAVAFGGLTVAAKGAVDSAAELGDSIGATRVIFGKAAKVVEQFSKKTAVSLGLSQQGALDAAGEFGTFGKAAGLSGVKLGKFATKMIQLSGDLASFRGGTAAEAVEAIGAAMRGETEPIRRYGVLLDDASLRQQALADGLIKTTKQALTPQQKTLAAYALILKQTGDAQGDFARTSDSAKNKAQAQSAALADLKARIGTGLLPAYGALLTAGLKLTDWFGTQALPAISGFAKGIKDSIGPAVSGVAGDIRTKFVPALQGAFDKVKAKLPKIDLSGTLRNIVTQVRGWAGPILVAFRAGLKSGDYGPLGIAIGTALRNAIAGASGIASKVFGAVSDWAGSVDWLQIGKRVGAQALPFVVGFANTLLDPLFSGEFWSKNWTEVLLFAVAFIPIGRGASLASRVAGRLGLEKGITKGIITGLEKTVGAVGRAVFDFVWFVLRKFGEGFSAALGVDNAIATFGRRLVLRFAGVGSDLASTATSVVGGFFVRFGGAVGRGIISLGSFGVRIVGALARGIASRISTLTLPVRQGLTLIAQDLTAAAGRAITWGTRLVGGVGRGLANGARNLVVPVRQGLTLVAQDVTAFAGRFYTRGAAAVRRLGAGLRAGASRFKDVLFEAGQQVMAGFLSGISSFYSSNVKPYLNFITSRLPFEKGPPAKDAKILIKSGQLVIGGFLVGLKSKYGDVRKSLSRFTAGIASRRDRKIARDALTGGANAFAASIAKQVAARKSALADLKTARKDYAKQVAAGLTGGGLTTISLDGLGNDPRVARSALVSGLQARLKAVRAFQTGLAALRKKGLSTSLLQQIADSGLESGAAYIASLRGATPALIRQINGLNSAIGGSANAAGNTVAGAVFDKRIKAAAVPLKIVIDAGTSRLDQLLLEVLRKALKDKGLKAVLG